MDELINATTLESMTITVADKGVMAPGSVCGTNDDVPMPDISRDISKAEAASGPLQPPDEIHGAPLLLYFFLLFVIFRRHVSEIAISRLSDGLRPVGCLTAAVRRQECTTFAHSFSAAPTRQDGHPPHPTHFIVTKTPLKSFHVDAFLGESWLFHSQ